MQIKTIELSLTPIEFEALRLHAQTHEWCKHKHLQPISDKIAAIDKRLEVAKRLLRFTESET